LVSINRVSNDVLFSEIRQKSRKPTELYQIIESMLPGAKKIELFARNHNIRPEWLSLGNQLGKYYDCDRDTIFCDHCKKEIVPGMRRYKSRSTKNLDFCYDCISKTSEDVQNFILLENNAEEMVFHEYFECNICKANPIPGIRFTCSICPSFDLCESCYDTSILIDSQIHKVVHNFDAFEIPELAGGLPIHVLKCQGCNTFPIVGYCFTCTICKQMQLCQKCFFSKKNPKTHCSSHRMEIYTQSYIGSAKEMKCACCSSVSESKPSFKCDSCFNFVLCDDCYWKNAAIPTSYVAHKASHTFTRFFENTSILFPPSSFSKELKLKALKQLDD